LIDSDGKRFNDSHGPWAIPPVRNALIIQSEPPEEVLEAVKSIQIYESENEPMQPVLIMKIKKGGMPLKIK
jgi:hypothetical protein